MSSKRKTQQRSTTFGVKSLWHLQKEIRDTTADELFDIEDIAQSVFDQLVIDFQPEGLLEELWLNDIASITMAIEKFRTIEGSVMLNMMLRNVNDHHAVKRLSDADHLWFRTRAESISLNKPHQVMSCDRESFKTVPNLTEEDIRRLAGIQDVIAKLQRERDRIYAQFERKRRPLIQAAVTKLEANALPPQLPD